MGRFFPIDTPMNFAPMNFVPNGSADSLERRVRDRPAVHFVTGREKILRLAEKLMDFSRRCDQSGSMHDLSYFLSKPGALPRIPHLLLAGTADLNVANPNLDDLAGCVLIFEQRISGFGVGAYATNDRSGRSTLIAPAGERMKVAAATCRALLNRGAHLIMLSFRTAEPDSFESSEPAGPRLGTRDKAVARWAQRDRTIPGYLPLASTYDATLATIGQRTRSNLRYYRRRAEAQLGCRFLPQIDASREELLAFNRECMYGAAASVAGWRYDSLKELAEPIFMGIKDRDGRWLSMLAGRRYLDRSELLWQLNRDGLAANSLSTVMRSYFIENEILRGARRVYIEGGTPHPIKFSFMPESLTDLVVMRQTVAAKVMQGIARRYISKDNELSHMLSAPERNWQAC
jgi:hypothetical protein